MTVRISMLDVECFLKKQYTAIMREKSHLHLDIIHECRFEGTCKKYFNLAILDGFIAVAYHRERRHGKYSRRSWIMFEQLREYVYNYVEKNSLGEVEDVEIIDLPPHWSSLPNTFQHILGTNSSPSNTSENKIQLKKRICMQELLPYCRDGMIEIFKKAFKRVINDVCREDGKSSISSSQGESDDTSQSGFDDMDSVVRILSGLHKESADSYCAY